MIFFRADGNPNIGVGHIMRCISIAKKVIANGDSVLFITADSQADDLLETSKLPHISMNTDYRNMMSEIPTLLDLFEQYEPSSIVVDSYYVSDRYFMALHNYVYVNYIDDMCNQVFPVDRIINYNICANRDDYIALYSENENQKIPDFVLGLRYTPLREVFSGRTTLIPPSKEKVTDILLSTGGSDPLDISAIFAKEWESYTELTDIKLHIVCGPFYQKTDDLYKLIGGAENIIIHKNVQDMVSLMDECQLAVASTGSTIYELCARKVPTISFYFVENQRRIAWAFDAKTPVVNAGDMSADQEAVLDKIFMNLRTLISDIDRRKDISEAMYRLVDGNGAERIAEILTKNY